MNEWIASIDFGIRLNPLIACTVLFLLPGVFLGTISPYVIRLAATKLNTVGSTAGTLYAVSTCRQYFRHAAYRVLFDTGIRRQQYYSFFGGHSGVSYR